MSIGCSDYFETHKKILSIIGFSFNINDRPFKVYGLIVFLLSGTLPILTLIASSQNDEILNQDGLFYSIAEIYAFVFIMMYVKTTKKTLKIMNMLQSEIFKSFKDVVVKSDIENCVSDGKRHVHVMITLYGLMLTVYFGAAGFFIQTEETGNLSLPFGQFPRLPQINEHYLLIIAYIYQIFFLTYFSVTYLTMHCLYCNILAHVCVQCKILAKDIRHIAEFNKEEEQTEDFNVSSTFTWDYLRSNLKRIVLHHYAINETAANVREVLSNPMLLVIGMYSLMVCSLLIVMKEVSFQHDKFMLYLLTLIALLIILGNNCYWSECLITESLAISNACYESNFIGTDLRYQKGLLFIMIRSQKPLTITIGKFTTLSTMTLVSVLKATYSYYTFLNDVHN